jgi:hypothetical protein
MVVVSRDRQGAGGPLGVVLRVAFVKCRAGGGIGGLCGTANRGLLYRTSNAQSFGRGECFSFVERTGNGNRFLRDDTQRDRQMQIQGFFTAFGRRRKQATATQAVEPQRQQQFPAGMTKKVTGNGGDRGKRNCLE